MQTFLPLPDFAASARCLDDRRLGKQRVEALQLLNGSFANHPASRMWRGYELCLVVYGLVVCQEWISRGYKDTCWLKVAAHAPVDASCTWDALPKPPWLGDERLHSSHRSNLLRKDSLHYSQFGWAEVPVAGYFWPV